MAEKFLNFHTVDHQFIIHLIPFFSGGGGFNGGGGRYDSAKGGFDNPGKALRNVDWNRHTLVPFEKDFYAPHPNIKDAHPKDVEKFRSENQITIMRGDNIPNPITNFAEAGFPDYVSHAIRQARFEKPTAIQAQGWSLGTSSIYLKIEYMYPKFNLTPSKLAKYQF